MDDLSNTNSHKRRGFFETIIEIAGWLQIFASPFLIAVVIASLIYFPQPNTISLVI